MMHIRLSAPGAGPPRVFGTVALLRLIRHAITNVCRSFCGVTRKYVGFRRFPPLMARAVGPGGEVKPVYGG